MIATEMAERKEESFGVIPLSERGYQWRVFIILHKDGNHWGFPKGNADLGETPLQSASRELEEETGLKITKLITDEPIIERYTFYRGPHKVQKTVHYFPAQVAGVVHLQPEEIREGKWLTFEEAQRTLTFEEGRKLCQKIEKLTQIQ